MELESPARTACWKSYDDRGRRTVTAFKRPELEKDIVRCPDCGALLEGDEQACPQCGARLEWSGEGDARRPRIAGADESSQ